MTKQYEGRLIRFDEAGGYGFIEHPEGGPDVFVHINDIDDDRHTLRVGSVLEFDIVEGDKGPRAVSVISIEDEEILSTSRYQTELTEALIQAEPSLTLGQLERVRAAVVAIADRHGWVD